MQRSSKRWVWEQLGTLIVPLKASYYLLGQPAYYLIVVTLLPIALVGLALTGEWDPDEAVRLLLHRSERCQEQV